jgi:hypothetical protein
MIRNTLHATKAATFCICLPNANAAGAPSPSGSGFFVSPDGWFVTAAHVVTENGQPNGPLRPDLANMLLARAAIAGTGLTLYRGVTCAYVDPLCDLALFKADLVDHQEGDETKPTTEFPYIEVSIRPIEEGESVYAYGYPLSDFARLPLPLVPAPLAVMLPPGAPAIHVELHPRVSAAIVSCRNDFAIILGTPRPMSYVIDQPLNYGISGGPVVATETGKVLAACTSFEPLTIPQPHVSVGGRPFPVVIPSLYGKVTSIANGSFMQALQQHNVTLSNS